MLSAINPVRRQQGGRRTVDEDATDMLMTLAKYVDRKGLSAQGFAMCYEEGGGDVDVDFEVILKKFLSSNPEIFARRGHDAGRSNMGGYPGGGIGAEPSYARSMGMGMGMPPGGARDRTFSDMPGSPQNWPKLTIDLPRGNVESPRGPGSVKASMPGGINTMGSFAGFSPPEKVKFIFNCFDRWAVWVSGGGQARGCVCCGEVIVHVMCGAEWFKQAEGRASG